VLIRESPACWPRERWPRERSAPIADSELSHDRASRAPGSPR